MVFSSLTFLFYFMPVFFALYYAGKNRTYRNAVLTLASLFFYAWGEPVWVSLLLLSALIDYNCGRYMAATDNQRARKTALIISVTANLSLLGFFKYQAFFIENVNALFSSNLPFLKIGLPIGISFYTFQTMSYSIDLYRGNISVQKRFFDFLLYVSLFPQLIAGPIVRYKDVEPDIRGRRESVDMFTSGLHRFIVGLAKKVILANTAGALASVYIDADPNYITTAAAWTGSMLLGFQTYFDFSGYSDMAIGLGAMLGFKFKENFNKPFISKSFTEFWSRWHISLWSFFRDYLYIPLGGNRSHYFRNIAIVWFLSGLWHGASWNFVLWAASWLAFIMLEKYILAGALKKMPNWLRHIYTLVVVTASWQLYYFTDLSDLFGFAQALFGFRGRGFIDAATVKFLTSNIFFILLCALAASSFGQILKNRFGAVQGSDINAGSVSYKVQAARAALSLGLFGISVAMLIGQSYNPFLYFRF